MAKKRERIFALTLALLFLVTSVGFTGVVIWQTHQDNKNKNDQEAALSALNQQNPQASKGQQLQGFTPVTNVTKLSSTDLKQGTGKEAKADSTVTVNYTGALAVNGVIFESSKDTGQPATFPLNQVIKGWGEGIPGMKVGGTRRLIIPANLAYGNQSPSADIPANSALVFDVELIAVQ